MLKNLLERFEKYGLLLILFTTIIALIVAPISNQVLLINNMPPWIKLSSGIVGIIITLAMSFNQAEISSEIDNGPGMIIEPTIAGGGVAGLLSISTYFIYQMIYLN
ncbi:MAG: hypothetical protein WC059_00125 [Candidatus Paceibacterota bacterium]